MRLCEPGFGYSLKGMASDLKAKKFHLVVLSTTTKKKGFGAAKNDIDIKRIVCFFLWFVCAGMFGFSLDIVARLFSVVHVCFRLAIE